MPWRPDRRGCMTRPDPLRWSAFRDNTIGPDPGNAGSIFRKAPPAPRRRDWLRHPTAFGPLMTTSPLPDPLERSLETSPKAPSLRRNATDANTHRCAETLVLASLSFGKPPPRRMIIRSMRQGRTDRGGRSHRRFGLKEPARPRRNNTEIRNILNGGIEGKPHMRLISC